jgi:hypothetical protein
MREPAVRSKPAALRIAALATGAVAAGALAIGVLAIARLAIGRLAVREARFRKVAIDELTVRRLHVLEDAPAHSTVSRGSTLSGGSLQDAAQRPTARGHAFSSGPH